MGGRFQIALVSVKTYARDRFDVCEVRSVIDAAAWQGVMAPAKTPPAIVQRVGAEIAKAMASPEIKAALAAQGAYSIASTPERDAAFFSSEMERYKKTVDELGLKLD